MKVVLNKESGAILNALDKDINNYFMDHVKVCKDKVIGSMGHSLYQITHAPVTDLEGIPAVTKVNDLPEGDFIIGLHDFKEAIDLINNKSTVDVFRNVVIGDGGDENKVECVSCNDNGTKSISCKKDSGDKYPAKEDIIRDFFKGTNDVSVSSDVSLSFVELERLFNILKGFGLNKKSKNKTVLIKVFTKGDDTEAKHITVEAENEKGQKLTGLIMPCAR